MLSFSDWIKQEGVSPELQKVFNDLGNAIQKSVDAGIKKATTGTPPKPLTGTAAQVPAGPTQPQQAQGAQTSSAIDPNQLKAALAQALK